MYVCTWYAVRYGNIVKKWTPEPQIYIPKVPVCIPYRSVVGKYLPTYLR